jgi:hypothetical protein
MLSDGEIKRLCGGNQKPLGKINWPKGCKTMKKDKTKSLLIEQLKKTPIVQIACEKAQIARASFYRWKIEDKEFAKKTEEALLEGETFITEMSESQLISMIRDGNFQAVQLWLRHHHPKYGQRIEISGNINQSQEDLNPEQEATVREALRLASLLPGEKPEKKIIN